jgi:hypothetical protein
MVRVTHHELSRLWNAVAISAMGIDIQNLHELAIYAVNPK